MPYMLISTQIRLESGPTNVGDEFSDPAVMSYLGARKTTMLGNNFPHIDSRAEVKSVGWNKEDVVVESFCFTDLNSEYHVDDPPRLVLDKLEKIGFRMLSMTGVGQTLVWCLHKETDGLTTMS